MCQLPPTYVYGYLRDVFGFNTNQSKNNERLIMTILGKGVFVLYMPLRLVMEICEPKMGKRF